MAQDKTHTDPSTSEASVDASVEASDNIETTAETAREAGSDSSSEVDPTELFAKLDEVTAEANQLRERCLRSVAELENYRKRSIRDKDEARKFANQMLLENFLPILDNFQMGLAAARQHEGGAAFADGFAMIQTQIENWLRDHGVEKLFPVEDAFDPNLHESIAHDASESVPEGHVISVTRAGYRLQDRLLRPAAVVVSSGAPAETEEASAGPGEEGSD